MNKFRFYLSLMISKTLFLLIKLFKLSATNKVGAIAIKICPNMLKYFKIHDLSKVIFITGTNGKSTTNNLLVHSLRSAGKSVCSNLAGANLYTGILNEIIKSSKLNGNIPCEYIVMETDERYLEKIYSDFKCGKLCITNIQKDQMQRNGTPEFIYNKLKVVAEKVDTLYLNADDPNSHSLRRFAKNFKTYSVETNDKSYSINDNDFSYTMSCYYCSDKIIFDTYNIDKVGKYHCKGCGQNNGNPDYFIKNINFNNKSFEYDGNTYSMPYEQSFFLYSYSLVVGILSEFGIKSNEINKAFASFKNISGRVETLKYPYIKDNKKISKDIKFIRIKQENSETLQSAIDYIALDTSDKTVILLFDELEDYLPYYASMFYNFEVDFSKIFKHTSKIIAFNKIIAYDIALMLEYNGYNFDNITVLTEKDTSILLKEIEKDLYGDNIYLISVLGRYNEIAKNINRSSK